MSNIITNTVLVLKQLLDEIVLKDTRIKPVFTPDLTQDKGVAMLRAKNNLEKVLVDNKEVALFLFNRSTLRNVEQGIGKRVIKPLLKDTINSTAIDFKVMYGEFDLRFAYSSPEFEDIELFEINHLLKEGVQSLRSFTLDMTAFGFDDLLYKISWEPLEELTIESDTRYNKLLLGTMKIRGAFITAVGEVKLINTIKTTIHDWASVVMMTSQIPAEVIGTVEGDFTFILNTKDKLDLAINGDLVQTVIFTEGVQTIIQVVASINSVFPQMASDDGSGKLKLRAAKVIEIKATSNVLNILGLTSGVFAG